MTADSSQPRPHHDPLAYADDVIRSVSSPAAGVGRKSIGQQQRRADLRFQQKSSANKPLVPKQVVLNVYNAAPGRARRQRADVLKKRGFEHRQGLQRAKGNKVSVAELRGVTETSPRSPW